MVVGISLGMAAAVGVVCILIIITMCWRLRQRKMGICKYQQNYKPMLLELGECVWLDIIHCYICSRVGPL